ncbi:MAG: Rrf2 family transcriptional regulator [Oxalobacter formigenes]|nr:Rrf2 family transcriptional regulator [Oxalobacter formigenes]
MTISTRCRYALRVLIDLAEQGKTDYVPIREVAARQRISLKYLEQILPVLRKNGLVLAVQGKGGGYRLARKPHEYKVSEILAATEGELVPVACLAKDAEACPRAASCKTLPMWREFARLTRDYFDGITLEDLVNQRISV